jgi:hypothetical protein
VNSAAWIRRRPFAGSSVANIPVIMINKSRNWRFYGERR